MKLFNLRAAAMTAGITTVVPLQMALADMPFDRPLTEIRDALTGQTAQIIVTLCIIVAGLGFAIGESGGFFKRVCGIVFGASIAVRAADLVGRWFS